MEVQAQESKMRCPACARRRFHLQRACRSSGRSRRGRRSSRGATAADAGPALVRRRLRGHT
eukprot:15386275-Alexandrium_andersonii.AAC.1